MIAADGTDVIEEVTTVATRVHPRVSFAGVWIALGAAALLAAILYAAHK
jgi:hypothetical protein